MALDMVGSTSLIGRRKKHVGNRLLFIVDVVVVIVLLRLQDLYDN